MAPFSGLPIYRAAIAIAPAVVGDNTLVAAVTGKRIRVIHINLQFSASAAVVFESGTGGPDLSGTFAVAANGKIHDSWENGFIETANGALLNMRSDTAVGTIGGWIAYQLPGN